MNCLVIIELQAGDAGDDALGVLSHAAALGLKPVALTLGEGGNPAHFSACGAVRLLQADELGMSEPHSERRCTAILELCDREPFDLILATATSLAGELFAGLAQRLGGGLLWGLTSLAREGDDLVGLRPVQSHTMMARHRWKSALRLGLFQPYSVPPVRGEAQSIPVEKLPVLAHNDRIRVVDRSTFIAGAVGLATADVIVSAGRGIGGPENLPLVEDLAAALGGTMGASLPVVEAGWVPRARQVGQTGTIVRPRLYVACGISGQIQHRLGMERSGKIIAINTDASAPIMNCCDLAVVGRVEKLLPELTGLVRKRNEGLT